MKLIRGFVLIISLSSLFALTLDSSVSIEEAIDKIKHHMISECTKDRHIDYILKNFKISSKVLFVSNSDGNQNFKSLNDVGKVNGEGELLLHPENIYLRGQKTETFVKSVTSNFTHGKPNGIEVTHYMDFHPLYIQFF